MTREQERAELHKTIWSLAENLRGSIDSWDFKNYVLGTMFYRYISEDLTQYINNNQKEVEGTDFDYAKKSDEFAERGRETTTKEKGFFLLPSELFCNVQRNASKDENLNETLGRVFQNIESSTRGRDSEKCFAGLFNDFDVNSNKLGGTVKTRNERLVKLLDGIASLNLGNIGDHNNDTFGDAYEYLMGMYAANAGKSGGEFYTPAEVSELLTRIGTVGKTRVNKVYDPACGSGSLLLKAKKILGNDGVTSGFYGQELMPTSFNLCRINMFLHGVEFDKIHIACGNTLTEPCEQHRDDDQPFDLICTNPPYSTKWDGDSNPLLINDERFAPAGVLAPKAKADMAFVMHCLSWLSACGTAAIVCFPGILYRGGAELKIRQYLVDNGFVDSIIQLPDNLFFGTSIATCIMVLKKGKQSNTTLFIDASKEFIKVTNSNKLTQENISNIVKMFEEQKDIPHVAHLATHQEIVEHGYNLSVSNYIEPEDTREKVDITKLNAEIEEIVAREEKLRNDIRDIIAEIEAAL